MDAGRLLAAWVVRADKVNDLSKRIEARQDQPMTQLPARVLSAQIALAAQDGRGPRISRGGSARRLEKETLQNTAELVCHALLPALTLPAQLGVALPVLERASKTLVTGNNDSAAGVLVRRPDFTSKRTTWPPAVSGYRNTRIWHRRRR